MDAARSSEDGVGGSPPAGGGVQSSDTWHDPLQDADEEGEQPTADQQNTEAAYRSADRRVIVDAEGCGQAGDEQGPCDPDQRDERPSSRRIPDLSATLINRKCHADRYSSAPIAAMRNGCCAMPE